MLIAHKARQTSRERGLDEFRQSAGVLDDASRSKNCKAYVNLGSFGPDLYYYAKMPASIKDMLKADFVQTKGVTPWSCRPHWHRYYKNAASQDIIH
jgi:hypothetical protein